MGANVIDIAARDDTLAPYFVAVFASAAVGDIIDAQRRTVVGLHVATGVARRSVGMLLRTDVTGGPLSQKLRDNGRPSGPVEEFLRT